MAIRHRIQGHVPATTALLSVVALSLVFAAALRVVPAETLPRAPDAVLDAIPHLNALVSLTALALVVAGVRSIRRGAVERHRRQMLGAFVLFAIFLVGYLYRVALLGPTEFAASGLLATAYLVILAVHVTLAVVCVPLLFYVLLLAWVHPVAELPRTNHPRVGRVAAPLWAVSFALGIVVYLLLYTVG
jgi:putative membrane protein